MIQVDFVFSASFWVSLLFANVLLNLFFFFYLSLYLFPLSIFPSTFFPFLFFLLPFFSFIFLSFEIGGGIGRRH